MTFFVSLIFAGLKSVLSETRIATPVFFVLHLLGRSSSIPLFWAYVCLYMWDGCPESTQCGDPPSVEMGVHTDGCGLLIQFASLCLLIGPFRPFTFKINIVMCEFDPVIMMLAGYFIH